MNSLDEIEASVTGAPNTGVSSLAAIEAQVNTASKPVNGVAPNPVVDAPTSLDQIEQSVAAPQVANPLSIPGFTGHTAHPLTAQIAMEYYGKADPQEALDAWVQDQTWNNANAAAALIDAVKAQTVDPIKAKQMAFLGEQFDNLPSFWEGDRPLTEKGVRLWANVWRGIVDPVTWLGGAVGGKVASKVIGEGAGLLARTAGATIADTVAGAAAETSQQVMKKEIGRQEDIDASQIAETAAISGITGGVIRGGAGLLKRLFTKPEIKPEVKPEAPSKLANDNTPYQYQLDKATPVETRDNKALLRRTQDAFDTEPVIPETANSNKYPVLERTAPIANEVDETTPIRNSEDGGLRFNDLQHLESTLEEQYEVPMQKVNKITESEPTLGQNNPFQDDVNAYMGIDKTQEPVVPVKNKLTRTKKEKVVVPPKQEPIQQEPITQYRKDDPIMDQVLRDNDDPPPVTIAKDDLTPPPIKPPKPPIMQEPPPPINEPPPYFVRTLDSLTGKTDNMTYKTSSPEWWGEIIRTSEANKGHMDVRGPISIEQTTNMAKELLGDNEVNIFDNLKKTLGLDKTRLSTIVSAGLYQYNKEAGYLSSLARNFIEKMEKLGLDHDETKDAMIAYAQSKMRFTDIQKSFYGSRSELGRSLNVLNPSSLGTPEQQMKYWRDVANSMINDPQGLYDSGAGILCQ